MLTDKIFFKLGPAIPSFYDKALNIELKTVAPGKTASFCYVHFINDHIYRGLYLKEIIQIDESEYLALYPETSHIGAPPVVITSPTPSITPGTKFQIMFGDNAPTTADGNNGDFYFHRFGKGRIYEKIASDWVLRYDFHVNHKLVIPFESVDSFPITWTEELSIIYGLYPHIQVWSQKEGEASGIMEVITANITRVPLASESTITLSFEMLTTGLIVIS